MLTPLLLGVAYTLGSIPFAYLLARRLSGVDLREIGSGNVGAANVLRTTGAAAALAALILDGAKGALAVLIARRFAAGDATAAAAGVAAVLGHSFSMWLGFRGGKGVATACGAFAVLAPVPTLLAASFFTVTVWLTRYVSLGSLVASITLPPMAYVTNAAGGIVVAAVCAAAVIIERHRSNLSRLMAGTERRFRSASQEGHASAFAACVQEPLRRDKSASQGPRVSQP